MVDGWKEVKLEEVVDKLGDGLHGTPKYDEVGEYYFINGNNLNGRIEINEKTKTVSDSEYRKHYRELNDRTILISINGTLGRVAVYNNEKVILGKSACYFNVKSDYSKDFIKYVMHSSLFKEYLNSHSTGTTIKNMGLKQMREFTFNIPTLEEQKAIAHILSTLDEKIETNNKINKTLEKMAQEIFKHWFVDFEFPNEDGEPYKSSGGEMIESELGLIPKGWEVVNLEKLCKQIKPGTNYQPKRISEGIPFLNVRNINQGYIDTTDSKYISMEDYNKAHKNWEPEVNDILISRIGTLGLVAVIRDRDIPIAVHYNFINVKPLNLSYQFLYFAFKSDKFQQQYHGIKKASVQEYVTIDEVKQLKFIVPSEVDCLKKLERTFNILYDNIEVNQAQNETLSNLRDTLLPKLMSGQIRVPLNNDQQ